MPELAFVAGQDQGRRWCQDLGHELALCALSPTLGSLHAIRRLLDARPIVRLPAEWERVVEEARAFVSQAEARLPVFAKPGLIDAANHALPVPVPAWAERYPG